MWYHGEERSETALQLVLLDAPLKLSETRQIMKAPGHRRIELEILP